MMYPRLMLLREFLAGDGVILISVDDTELGHLRFIMDEIFGKPNFLGSFAWNTRNTDNRVGTYLSPDHEYIICLRKIEGNRFDPWPTHRPQRFTSTPTTIREAPMLPIH